MALVPTESGKGKLFFRDSFSVSFEIVVGFPEPYSSISNSSRRVISDWNFSFDIRIEMFSKLFFNSILLFV